MKVLRFALPLVLFTGASLIIGCGSNTPGGGGSPTPTPTTPPCADATPPPPAPKMLSPYVDVTIPFDAVQAAQYSGHASYTLSFLVAGGSCRAVWGDIARYPLGFNNDQVNGLRARGGTVRMSFGGFSGTELALACASVAELQAAYQEVITTYALTWIDFDIESTTLNNTAANARRNLALVGLQKANPTLRVDFTLPVATTGLTEAGQALLKDAKCAGVSINAVNILAMDYGGAIDDMGAAAVSAANGTLTQLGALGLPTTKIGITVMIGQNDVAGEVFDGADAGTVLTYAQSKPQVSQLSLWSANRDNGGCAGFSAAQSTCSGLAQGFLDFTIFFMTYK
jgi:hypothetical protein